MPVKVELKLERTPRGNTQITESKFRVNEVEVIMKAFTAIINHGVFTGLPIMPGFVTGTGFHGRENVHQSRMTATLFQNRVNAVFLAKSFYFTNELDLNAIFRSKALGIGTDLLSKRHSQFFRIIKDLYLLTMQERGHAICKAPNGDSPPQDNAIIAGKSTKDLFFILFSNHFSRPWLNF